MDRKIDRYVDGQKDRQIRRWTEMNRHGNKRAGGQIDRNTGGFT